MATLKTLAKPVPPDPHRNPSYPVRTHTDERSTWTTLVAEWDRRIAESSRTPGPSSDARKLRVDAQMLGARDQLATAASRLPGEVADLYEEDRHRLDQAVEALERLFRDWEQTR